jgi:RNA polymerase primary sigma factor
LARSFGEAPRQAWIRFERFFGADIRRRVVRRFPRHADTAAREDVYQEICLKLIEDDYRRVRAYDGRGSFTGFILTVVERILIDLVRRAAPRRRLPAAIARLTALDQEVYAAIAWEDCPADPERLGTVLRGRLERDPDHDEIRQAIARVAEAARGEVTAASPRTETVSLDLASESGEGLAIPDPGLSPEDQLLVAEEEKARSALVSALKSAAAKLPAEERLYLQVVFSATDPLPPREIAKMMGCAVEDVYRFKQRVQRWMAEFAARRSRKNQTCPSDPLEGEIRWSPGGDQ